MIWPRSHSLPSYYNGKGCKGLWDLSEDPEIPAAPPAPGGGAGEPLRRPTDCLAPVLTPHSIQFLQWLHCGGGGAGERLLTTGFGFGQWRVGRNVHAPAPSLGVKRPRGFLLALPRFRHRQEKHVP